MHTHVTWRSGSNVHGPHSCYTVLSLPACTYGFKGGSLWSVYGGREEFVNYHLQIVLQVMQASPYAVKSSSTTAPFWEITEVKWWRKIHPVGRTAYSALGCSHCFKGETAQIFVIIYIFMGCSQSVTWKVRNLERIWLKNWWQGNLGKKYVDRLLWMGKKCEDICVPYEFCPQLTSAEEDFSN